MSWKILLILNLLILIVGFFGAVYVSNYLKEQEVKRDEQRRKDLYEKILDAASISPTKLTVNFTKPISTGSPLIFGGAHTPPLDQIDAWNKIVDAGVTMIRRDFFMEYILKIYS